MQSNRPTTVLVALLLVAVSSSVASAQATVTTSGGDVVTFNQKNLVNHMIVADSLELVAAKTAEGMATNPAVRSFAQMLVRDHQKEFDQLYQLAGKGDIGREPNPSDMSEVRDIRMLDRLRDMPTGPEFDRAFVLQQIRDHTRDINMLQQLRPAAKDDDVRKEIDRVMPVLERHLARARELGAQLGIPASEMRNGWRDRDRDHDQH